MYLLLKGSLPPLFLIFQPIFRVVLHCSSALREAPVHTNIFLNSILDGSITVGVILMNKELSFPFIEGAIQKGCICIYVGFICTHVFMLDLYNVFHRLLHGWVGNCGISIRLHIIYF